MPTLKIRRSSPVVETPRVMQMRGIFDVPPSRESEQTWEFDVEIPADWNIGLIVGPSAAGKTTLARELFGDKLITGWDWAADRSVLDGFPAALGIKEVIELLSSVGFSSPPAWLRPFHVLSNGEQFRVNLARTLAESPALAVVDEFSSVVDRQVAQIASNSIAKAVRRRGQQFVAVACHYDIIDWLDPDWIFQPHIGRLERRSLQGRPEVELEIYPADRSAWQLFKPHHYLNSKLHTASTSFMACLNGRPVAFDSYLHFPHPKVRDIKIGHRLVVLPDYQGLGIGGRFEEWLGQYLHERGYRYHNVTSHPALVAYCNRSLRWKLTGRGGGFKNKSTVNTSRSSIHLKRKQGNARRYATFTFEYIPPGKISPCSDASSAARFTASV
jgi:GNAT superfamily N-acetyltransferase/ABC-type thiamine transport system ATPase subunit